MEVLLDAFVPYSIPTLASVIEPLERSFAHSILVSSSTISLGNRAGMISLQLAGL